MEDGAGLSFPYQKDFKDSNLMKSTQIQLPASQRGPEGPEELMHVPKLSKRLDACHTGGSKHQLVRAALPGR